MSWGFFADLRVSIPTTEWHKLRARALSDISLPKGWLGLEDEQLEASFLRPEGGGESLGQVLAWQCYRGTETIRELDEANGTTNIRVCRLLDKSQAELVFPLAAILEAAHSSGATGSLRLVNDGTYSGEDGVEISARDGKLEKTRLKDCWQFVESLGAELVEHASKPKKPRKSAKAKDASTKPKAKAKTKAPVVPPPAAPVVARSVSELLAPDTWPFEAGELELLSRADLETLAAAVGTAEGWGRQNAIQAVFALDPQRAYDRFAPYFAYVDEPVGDDAETTVSHVVLAMITSDVGGLQHNGWYAADPRWEELALKIVTRHHHDYDTAWELLARAKSARGLRAMLEQLPKLESFRGLFHVLVLLPPKDAIPALRKELERRSKGPDTFGLKSAIKTLEALGQTSS